MTPVSCVSTASGRTLRGGRVGRSGERKVRERFKYEENR